MAIVVTVEQRSMHIARNKAYSSDRIWRIGSYHKTFCRWSDDGARTSLATDLRRRVIHDELKDPLLNGISLPKGESVAQCRM